MSRPSLLILLGSLVMFMPYSGLPSSWVTVLLLLFGASIVGVGFSIRNTHVRNAIKKEAMREASPSEPALPQAPHGVSSI